MNLTTLKELEELNECLKFIKTKNSLLYSKLELLYDGSTFNFDDSNNTYDVIATIDNFINSFTYTEDYIYDLFLIVCYKPFNHEVDESEIHFSIDSFINAINMYSNIIFENESVVISKQHAFLPISVMQDNLDSLYYHGVWGEYEDSINSFNNSILNYSFDYNDSNFNLSIVSGFNLYSMIALENDLYSFHEHYILIKIESEINFSPEDLNLIITLANSYLFSLNYSGVIHGELSSRVKEDFDFKIDEIETSLSENKDFTFLFAEGTNKVISLYNSTFDKIDLEYKILQYNKIIEAISDTVRVVMLHNLILEYQPIFKTNISQSSIFELEKEIVKINNNFNNQIDEIEQTLKLIFIEDDFNSLKLPSFINSYVNKHKNANIFTILAKSIAHTRNSIAHNKFTFKDKILTCPTDEYEDFVDLLNTLIKKLIIWYIDTDDNVKVTLP